MNLEQQLLYEKTRANYWEARSNLTLKMFSLGGQITALRPTINHARETALNQQLQALNEQQKQADEEYLIALSIIEEKE